MPNISKETLLQVHEMETGQYGEEDFQLIKLWVYTHETLKAILKDMKYKKIGTVNDYPDIFGDNSDTVDAFDLTADTDNFMCLGYSKKFNSILYYSAERYAVQLMFFVPNEKLKKFSKTLGPIIRQDNKSSVFETVKFDNRAGFYHELSNEEGHEMKEAELPVKEIIKEKLVFEETATIHEVKNDIKNFFKKETKELYDRLDIAYKRGVILWGNPGNGKSAMIREIVRTSDKIVKVVINPGVDRVTSMLAALIKGLKGQPAIIVIEDIDSLIDDYNRSDFLNILDGVGAHSSIYFIGTTNYPERIDPAFMNRAGRFDRTFQIEDPSEATRAKFFKSRKVNKLVEEFQILPTDSKETLTDDTVVELFTKASEGLAMASLKELMTATLYLLANSANDLSVAEALDKVSETLKGSKKDHDEAHDEFMNKRSEGPAVSVRKPRRVRISPRK